MLSLLPLSENAAHLIISPVVTVLFTMSMVAFEQTHTGVQDFALVPVMVTVESLMVPFPVKMMPL